MNTEIEEQEIEETEQPEVEAEETEEAPEGTEVQDETEATEEDYEYDFGNGAKFKTQKEALKYSQELIRQQELELAQANAYRQAAQEFRTPQVQEPQEVPKTKEELEAEFYSDPIGTINKVATQTKAQLLAEQQAKKEDERIWNDFVNDHPELANFQDEVTALVIKEAALFQSVTRTRGEKAARDLAAQKMKAKLSMFAQAGKPKKELGKDKSVTPQGTQSSVTKKKEEEKTMSLKEQMAILNKKRRGL